MFVTNLKKLDSKMIWALIDRTQQWNLNRPDRNEYEKTVSTSIIGGFPTSIDRIATQTRLSAGKDSRGILSMDLRLH